MKVKMLITIVILVAAVGIFMVSRHVHSSSAPKAAKELYYCPMHPNFTSDKPGNCAICGMSLVKRTTASQAEQKMELGKSKKILFYHSPMNPAITSPVPMKDQMGMDYVPVYEEQTSEAKSSGVRINPEKQQLIGVKKGRVEKRKLSGQILTVGRVAYDPALFTAQQEYLQAMKSSRVTEKGNLNYIEEQSASLIGSMKQKLLAIGMSEAEIDELEKRGKPEQNLYLPGEQDKDIWVYITIYEYEAGLVKTGTPVEVQMAAYPGEVFEGKIISIAPILESETRTLKARALVNNPDNKLKLWMFANVAIKYDLGEKLAVPQEAVMHAGTRDIVFVADANGYFESRTVTLGVKAQNYYEVLRGLTENEEVITSGNFLIDSESKLNAVLSQMTEPNK